MFMFGLRWTRKANAKSPLAINSYAGAGDGYRYDTVDQNGNPLPSVKHLQPIMDVMQKALGQDMSQYDGANRSFIPRGLRT